MPNMDHPHSKPRPPGPRRIPRPDPRRLIAVFPAVLALLLVSGCRRPARTEAPPPPSVTVAAPAQRPVAEFLDLTGTVAASRTVDLVARVSGFLDSVHFADGALVDAGQLLFVIEPAPYQQQVALNEAALAQAQSEYERQQALVKENATSVSSVEKWLSTRDQAKAQLELARINLGYTRVTAPFTGRIGRRLVDPGNLVGAGGATKLATLEQLRPIYVNFSVNERDALYLRDRMKQVGLDPKASVGKLPVFAGLANEQGFPHRGTLDFTDNEISTTTGTISLRAVFPNEDRTLFPGLFTRVHIPLGEPQPMLVVPGSAIGSDQQGDYVLVVGDRDIVARRSVVKGPAVPDGTAIRSGLALADRVVVNGIQNARPGIRVTPIQATPAAAASRP